jgi:hypothetical protein
MVYKKGTKKKYKGGSTDTTVPTMSSNATKAVSVGVQGINTMVDYAINQLAISIGENPNESVEQTLSHISNKLDKLKNVIQSPGGKKILYDIGVIVKELGNEVVGPAINEISGVVVNKSGEIGKQIIKTGLDVVGVVPVVGEAVEAVRAASDVIRAGEQVVETGAKITGISAEVVGKVNDKKQQIQGLLSRLINVVSNGVDTINQGVSLGLDSAQYGLNKVTDKNAVTENNNFKSIQRGGAQSAKRTYMAQVEFLKPAFHKSITRKRKRKRRIG